MGPRAARITREDFVTPPEFSGLHLSAHGAGRIGGARIELEPHGGETRLGTCYQQVPVRLMPPFAVGDEPASLLYLINLTAGLMDGDGHFIDLIARTGTRAVVTGQSATRVHPALDRYCTQQWAVHVEDDACLVVLPGPVIPFRDSRYYQHGRVELAGRARLIWGDIWLAGRYDRGALSERFQFEHIVQDFEVRRSGRLVYRDRFRWDGPWSPDDARWFFGGSLACASLYVAGPLPEGLPPPEPSLRRAVLRLESGEHALRWCGHPSAVTTDLVSTTMAIAARWTIGPDAAPWLLASSSLAPNHWFSAVNGQLSS